MCDVEKQKCIKNILDIAYNALSEKGYDPINQITGYLISGDPVYITTYQNARAYILKVERDEIMEYLMKEYVTKNYKH